MFGGNGGVGYGLDAGGAIAVDITLSVKERRYFSECLFKHGQTGSRSSTL